MRVWILVGLEVGLFVSVGPFPRVSRQLQAHCGHLALLSRLCGPVARPFSINISMLAKGLR